MQQYFSKFKNKQILIIGDLLLDEYIVGESERISPEAPIPIVSVRTSYSVLGGAGNCGAAMSAMEAKPTIMGLIGKDSEGQRIKELCLEQRIKLISWSNNRPTSIKTRVLAPQQQLLRIDREQTSPIKTQLEQQILNRVKKIIEKQSAILLSDYNKGFLTENLCASVIKLAKQFKIPVLVDPKPTHKHFYQNCDYISPNWTEGKALSHLTQAKFELDDIQKVAQQIAKDLKSNVILTLGSKGVFYQDKNLIKSNYFETQAKEVFDVSGAGDTIISWITMGIASDLTQQESIHCANVAAGLVVAKRGTSIIYPNDFNLERTFLKNPSELQQLANHLHLKNKKIVSLNGAFDILHSGHMKILQEAKEQGHILVVGLNSDSSIKKYKDKNRPIIPEEERALMLLHTRSVDFVYLFQEQTPLNFIRILKPSVHVNGSEYGKNCLEAPTLKKMGSKLHIVTLKKGLSTSHIIKKIQNIYE